MQQIVGELQPGALPCVAVDADVIDLVLAFARHVRLEGLQHVAKDGLGLRRRHPHGRLDPRAVVADDGEQLVLRVRSERDQRAAVIEQHAVGVTHPHILIAVAKRLTHLDDKGAAKMVDVGDKATTVREAMAECVVRMQPETIAAVREGTAKGDALQVARIAGIMAAKKTPDLVPLAHPLPITSVSVDFELVDVGVRVLVRVRVTGQTGVEMEALTAAAVAGLTLIDMTKGVERGVYLENVRLLEKSGGRSGTWKRGA